jgi:hypothetical protein
MVYINFGFHLHYENPRVASICHNLISVIDHSNHSKEVKETIEKDASLDRITGPYNRRPLSILRLSTLGL